MGGRVERCATRPLRARTDAIPLAAVVARDLCRIDRTRSPAPRSSTEDRPPARGTAARSALERSGLGGRGRGSSPRFSWWSGLPPPSASSRDQRDRPASTRRRAPRSRSRCRPSPSRTSIRGPRVPSARERAPRRSRSTSRETRGRRTPRRASPRARLRVDFSRPITSADGARARPKSAASRPRRSAQRRVATVARQRDHASDVHNDARWLARSTSRQSTSKRASIERAIATASSKRFSSAKISSSVQ